MRRRFPTASGLSGTEPPGTGARHAHAHAVD